MSEIRPGQPRGILAVLSLNWVLLCGWTWWLYATWNVHVDFAMRSQAVNGILSGNWNPGYSIMGWTHLADHFDLSIYPLAYLTTLWPHMQWAFIVQVTLLVIAEWGVLKILDDFVMEPWWPPQISRSSAAWSVLLMLCLNPFLIYGVGSDLHMHMYGAVCGSVLTILFFLRARWLEVAVLVVATMMFGDYSAQLLIVTALSLTWVKWNEPVSRRVAAAIAVAALAWWVLMQHLGAGQGSEFPLHFGYLVGGNHAHASLYSVMIGFVTHPWRAIGRFPSAAASLWGPISIGGIAGLLTPLSIPTWLNLGETGAGMQSWVGWPAPTPGAMAEMPWQLVPTLIFEPMLTVVALGWLIRRPGHRRPRLARSMTFILCILVFNAACWMAVWVPKLMATARATPPQTVQVLNSVLARIPTSNEVVSSIGPVGRFGSRKHLYLTLFGSSTTVIPLETKVVDFVITPVTGQESNEVDLPFLTSFLLMQPNSKLLERRANVWFIEYHRLPGQSQLVVHYSDRGVIGAALPIPQGVDTQIGWPATSCVWSRAAKPGLLVDRYVNALKPGWYSMGVRSAGTRPIVVEVGDIDSNRYLGKYFIRSAPGMQRSSFNFRVTASGRIPVSIGFWPYKVFYPIAQRSDIIGIRILAMGKGIRSICDVSINPIAAPNSESSKR